MSKALIVAAEIIKKECSKYVGCTGCFYCKKDEEGFNECIVENYETSPSQWDLSELEKKND